MDRMIIQFGRSKLMLGLIVAVGLVFGYLSYSQADDPTLSLLIEEPVIREDLESFRNFKIDFSILDDKRYKNLEVFGENPVDLGIVGERENPFAPF
jgi:hypothetical protein